MERQSLEPWARPYSGCIPPRGNETMECHGNMIWHWDFFTDMLLDDRSKSSSIQSSKCVDIMFATLSTFRLIAEVCTTLGPAAGHFKVLSNTLQWFKSLLWKVCPIYTKINYIHIKKHLVFHDDVSLPKCYCFSLCRFANDFSEEDLPTIRLFVAPNSWMLIDLLLNRTLLWLLYIYIYKPQTNK